MYEIVKDVPTPSRDNFGRGRTRRYPFADMDVGDSFLVTDRTTGAIAQAIRRANTTLEGKRFGYRTVSDGVRVWRIE